MGGRHLEDGRGCVLDVDTARATYQHHPAYTTRAPLGAQAHLKGLSFRVEGSALSLVQDLGQWSWMRVSGGISSYGVSSRKPIRL